jgi:glycosyltransferase involved in cell wall biosynthesis
MNRKRLAILTTHPIQYQAPWFRALAAHPDLEVEVFFAHKATPEEQAAAGFGVKFDWDIPLLDGYRFRFLKNVAKRPGLRDFFGLDTPEVGDVVRQGRYDAVLVNGWHYKSAWQGIWACWSTGTPVMVRGDSHLYTPRHWVKRLLKEPLYRWFIPRFDACLAVGRWSREYYLHYGARPERVFFVPHFVDNGWFGRQAARWRSRRSEVRTQFWIEEAAVVFLFVGKFIEIKRPLDFVRALQLCAETGVGVQGLMVGDGPLRAVCEQFARDRGTPVRFAGFLNQSEIARAYAASDVLVLPSAGETWGLAVNEAMACGLPAIVSNQVGCGPDLVEPGSTGDVFPMGDVERLAMAIRVWCDPVRRCGASAAIARKIAGYSIERAVEGTLEALHAVCEKRALAAPRAKHAWPGFDREGNG